MHLSVSPKFENSHCAACRGFPGRHARPELDASDRGVIWLWSQCATPVSTSIPAEKSSARFARRRADTYPGGRTMTKRTWLFRLLTTLLIFGLAACGGSGGGGGGGGGGGIPTATNSAITPPPTTPVAITTSGGVTTSQANQSIAANALQASDGAMGSGLAA